MTGLISPSMMCADIENLSAQLSVFEENKVEYLHLDIMDGLFVPNFTLGTDYCKTLKRITSIPADYHLMIERPEDKLDWFSITRGDIVSVHWESTPHINKALSKIRQCGARAFAAINPGTPVCVLEDMLDDVDGVLVMTVNPGFAGQKMIPSTLKKITKIRRMLDERGMTDKMIEVDGNVSFENAKLMREAGADIFVAGTSGVFSPSLSLTEGIKKFREAIR